MKFKLSKTEWEALSDEQKELYSAKGDDYQLKIDGLPDFDGMQTKLNDLLGETKAAKQAKAEAEAKAKAEAEEAAKKNGDITALEKSWSDKLTQANAKAEAVKQKYHGQISKLMVTNEAQALASKLFGEDAALFMPHIISRLALEEADNGEFKTRVLDGKGEKSSLSLDELDQEFRASKAFSKHIVTSRATGPSGAVQNSTQHLSMTSRDDGASEEERLRLLRDNPEEFKRKYGVRLN